MITGVTGFVGRYLAVHCLEEGDTVCGIGRSPTSWPKRDPRIDVFIADIQDKSALHQVIEHCRPDTIFHLAGQASVSESWRDPAGTLVANVVGTANLLQAIVDSQTSPTVVIAGSSECYGLVRPEDNPVVETAPLLPVTPYGVSKAAQDLLGYQFAQGHGLRVVRMRPFNHIGPGQTDRFVVASFAKQIAAIDVLGARPVLHVGDLSAERDFTDVRDIVEGYREASLHAEAGEAYNIGSERAVPIRWIVECLAALASGPVRVEVDPSLLRPVDVPRIVANCAKFYRASGWRPRIGLEESLRDVLQEWRVTLAEHSALGMPSRDV